MMRQLLAWTCYWAGHCVGYFSNLYPDDWSERGHAPLYRSYQALMHWSVSLDNGSIWQQIDCIDCEIDGNPG